MVSCLLVLACGGGGSSSTAADTDPGAGSGEDPQPDVGQPDGPAPSSYTRLGELQGYSRAEGYFMPVYESPEHAWSLIEAMCGPVGSWDHEIVLPYRQEAYSPEEGNFKNLKGCIHVKGELGPNGERPKISEDGYLNATAGYQGQLSRGGIFIENIEANAVGIPNNRYFAVMHNLYLHDWNSHAMITSGGNKHMYVELKDSHLSTGWKNHAVYIDNIAYFYAEGNVIESPGKGHALRSIAARGIIRDNLICSVYCDGTTREIEDKPYDWAGMAPLEVYVNGEHLVDGNEIRYYRPSNSAALMASTFRMREGFNSLDRYRSGKYIPLPEGTDSVFEGIEQYDYLVWGTDEYNDPQTWNFPMLETIVRNHKVICQGEPCYAWDVRSTYPFIHDKPKAELASWWKENKFPDWNSLLENADPSWRGTLELMSQKWRDNYLKKEGRGLPNKIPFPVPEGWQQKARIVVDGEVEITNGMGLVRERDFNSDGGWCLGEIESGLCVNQQYYAQAEIVRRGESSEPASAPPTESPNWVSALRPYIPEAAGTVKLIPGTATGGVTNLDDGTPECWYLNCHFSENFLSIWSDMAFDFEKGCAWFVAEGGHGDLGANSVYRFCFDGLSWQRVHDYDSPTDLNCGPLEDGPVGIHSYDSEVFVPSRNMIFKLGTGAYNPNADCERIAEPDMWGWKESGGWEKLAENTGYRFVRTAYDSARDKIYFIEQNPDGFYEMDPHTLEISKRFSTWAGKGGTMYMDGRHVYWTSPGQGLNRMQVSESGVLGQREVLSESEAIDFGRWGLAVSNGVPVMWAGDNRFVHFENGQSSMVTAKGDTLQSSDDVQRVYGKFVAVPGEPGVFVGISGSDGWIVYRAF